MTRPDMLFEYFILFMQALLNLLRPLGVRNNSPERNWPSFFLIARRIFCPQCLQQKFKQEAGDSTYFSNPGNNDGDTNDSVGGCPTQAVESLSVWSHLTQSGMLTGDKFVWSNPAIGCAGYAGAKGVSPVTKVSSIVNATGLNPVLYGYNSRALSGFGGKNYYRLFLIVVKPELLWGLENKLDDGVPSRSTGSIHSGTLFYDFYDCTAEGVAQDVAYNGPDYGYCNAWIHFSPTIEIPITPK